MTVEEIKALADEVQKAGEELSELAENNPEALTDELADEISYLSFVCENFTNTYKDNL